MHILRIHQRDRTSENTFPVTVRYDLEDEPIEMSLEFQLTEDEQEKIRWYLEDYLEHPLDPAPDIALGVEEIMIEKGEALFKAIFEENDEARDLYAQLRDHLDDTRVEVVTSVQEATSIPWELMRDSRTERPIALRAASFVRTRHVRPRSRVTLPKPTAAGEAIRILLVICRPGRGVDVPFRSVAGRILKSLTAANRETYQLDVLRPATFEALSAKLRAAKQAGKPYHIVHFDGHGTYGDYGGGASTYQPTPRRFASEGKRGYLVFEKPGTQSNTELVDGKTIGDLLVETDTPLLVLNACQSAYAEAPDEPETDAAAASDQREAIRAIGTLAQQVMDTGVAGVVAMRYSVYVVTAARFVADLYASLVRGRGLGEAVSDGRRQLQANPQRTIAYDPVPLQDWMVPVVYEAARLELFRGKTATGEIKIVLDGGVSETQGAIDRALPLEPDAGFFGRDETLLALDRAYDTEAIALLHAYAGSGKTTTAAEFARWYQTTGGLGRNGVVLFSSFERRHTLKDALTQDFGRVFAPTLEASGIQWSAVTELEQQIDVALQVFAQIPVLWIWDNVEPVAGFPTGADSEWSAAEQNGLVDFLRRARGTKAKFLLTSRRDEQGWLGELPLRVAVPPMPMRERIQLTQALAEKRGHHISDVRDWRPLLRYAAGNPLAMTVLVGQALREGLTTRAQIEDFVDRLRRGEGEIDDGEEATADDAEMRSKKLGASLAYGFRENFSEEEAAVLALLHLFQGFVDVDALIYMGRDWNPGQLDAVKGLTRERGIALLDRAAEVGLLRKIVDGYYTIHPALPWYFRALFAQHHPDAERARRAYVGAMGQLGNMYQRQYIAGNRGVIAALEAEEANLLHARRLALAAGWLDDVIRTMQGLRNLYEQTGGRAAWRALVDEVEPHFIADDGGPKPGVNPEDWRLVSDYRVWLARQDRDYATALRQKQREVDYSRENAAGLLDQPDLSDTERGQLRSLGVAVETLGHIQRETGDPACVDSYQERIRIAKHTGDTAGEAISAFNLGRAYTDLPAIRDLAAAQIWYERSLELTPESDRLNRAKMIGQLGLVARARFDAARDAGDTDAALAHLNEAARRYHEKMRLEPENAVDERAITHNALGVIYKDAGDVERALGHYREAIRFFEQANALYNAALARENVANMLWGQPDRNDDALLYAGAALRNYEAFGPRAADRVAKAQRLIAAILAEMGRRDEALESAQQSLALYQQLGMASEVARTQQLIALLGGGPS